MFVSGFSVKSEKKSLILYGWESRGHENENYYLFGDRTRGTFLNIIASNEDNPVSRKDNFVNVNAFNSVYSLTVAFCTIS